MELETNYFKPAEGNALRGIYLISVESASLPLLFKGTCSAIIGFNLIKIHLLVARSPCKISSRRIQNLRGSFL